MTIIDILDICETPRFRIQVQTWKTNGKWHCSGVRRLREGVRAIDDLDGRAYRGEKDQPQ